MDDVLKSFTENGSIAKLGKTDEIGDLLRNGRSAKTEQIGDLTQNGKVADLTKNDKAAADHPARRFIRSINERRSSAPGGDVAVTRCHR